ncbi:hypothetical protein [Raineyella fluvialis]|uniref:Uncharacterized protein n=1 Tax=Raineyella fluvialis TaxID=2662261 RepID=A0A5Q2FBI3_9ACTN|nr:hypothetical protein [Raineyella fluvialis]QGF24098.1 hypothetical protein Rai3103_10875 [Raineyella fluvialis]
MVPLEVNGGAASSSAEVIIFGVLAVAVLAIGLLLFRSLKKIDVPYADELRQRDLAEGAAEAEVQDEPERPGPDQAPGEAPEDRRESGSQA